MKSLDLRIIFRKTPWVLFLLMVLFLTGCAAVGPNYIPPGISPPFAWHTELKAGLTPGKVDPETLSAWWNLLGDPELSSLIKRSVRGNLDVKKALARVREVRARRALAQTDLFPTFDASGSATWSRSSKDTGGGKSNDVYKGSFDAGWELDLFGGIRRSVEASEADLRATEEDFRDVVISLVSEVALNYIEVRTFQNRLAVAEANLEIQEESYQLALWRFQAGLSDELAVEQARYNLESTRSQIPSLRVGLEESLNRLAILLGEEPGKIHKYLEERKPIPVPPIEVVVGIPAEVLRQRPDIRRAEHELAAQTARVGVAVAELYPKFSLSGSIGLETFSLNHLSSSGILTLTGGPKISWAIFRAGAIRQNIEIQSAIQEQYLIAYEAAVLNALKEVENALVAYGEEHDRRRSLNEAVQAARTAVELARHKYQSGLSDFGAVLDAERSLLSLQDQFVQSEGEIVSNLIRLYKALGGGWNSLMMEGGGGGFYRGKKNEG